MRLIVGLALLLTLSAFAAVDPAAVRQEVERIEDLRILYQYTIQDLHDARALSVYLEGWKAPSRAAEVEDMFREAEYLYEQLRAIDFGASGLLAEVDALGKGSPSPDRLALLQRARRDVAARVNDFHARGSALKAALTAAVKQAATAAGVRWTVVNEPAPWPDPAREAGRQAGLRYGASFTADFFSIPEAEQDYELAKEAKAGVTFAGVLWAPSGNWADIEREPGVYDFAALDAMLARFAKHKMTVWLKLTSLTGTPPAWHVTQAGADSQFVQTLPDGQGVKKVRSGINLFHPATGQAYAAFLTAYAAHLKDKWPQVVDAVYIEGNQLELAAVADESAAMDAYWKAWSKGATAWQTPEALRAAGGEKEALAVKADQCREAWLLDYARRISEALRKGWPELPVQIVTVDDNFHRMINYRAEKSRDLYKLAQWPGPPVTGTSTAPAFDLLRSFAGERWIWHYWMSFGCGTKEGAHLWESAFRDVTAIPYGTGMGFLTRKNYPAAWYRYSDGQLGDFGIGACYLASRQVQEVSPVVLNTRIAPARVAILWSQTSLRRDPRQQLHKAAMAWGHLLTRTYFPYDYLAEDNLAEKLKNYAVLILPETQSLSLVTCDTIRAWVNDGGSLIATSAPGLYDESGARRTSLPLADVFGADVARLREPAPINPDKLFTGHPEGAYSGELPPRQHMFDSNLTAALKLTTGKDRAWYPGEAKEIAIAENAYGKGKALLCGYPIGFLYWETTPYEITYGTSHERDTNYNEEQKRYERWIVAEMAKLGAVRPVIALRGSFLRSQKGDDPDWTHVFRAGPTYAEYFYENDEPARTVETFLRTRDGIDNLYVGLLNTEMNHFTERGYIVSTLTGGTTTASVALPETVPSPVILDARLGVPVPCTITKGRATFTTWLPIAQAAAFAVAPTGTVRLFGVGKPGGEGPEAIAQRTAGMTAGDKPAAVEILDPQAIAAWLQARKGKDITIGYGDQRFRAAAEALATWLKAKYALNMTLSATGPRASNEYYYMMSFGHIVPYPDPVKADILLGNCQDNGLMWRYTWAETDRYWLPLDINRVFPGMGRAVVALSAPVVTDRSGKAAGKKADQQLIIGASFPTEALQGVEALKKRVK